MGIGSPDVPKAPWPLCYAARLGRGLAKKRWRESLLPYNLQFTHLKQWPTERMGFFPLGVGRPLVPMIH